MPDLEALRPTNTSRDCDLSKIAGKKRILEGDQDKARIPPCLPTDDAASMDSEIRAQRKNSKKKQLDDLAVWRWRAVHLNGFGVIEHLRQLEQAARDKAAKTREVLCVQQIVF